MAKDFEINEYAEVVSDTDILLRRAPETEEDKLKSECIALEYEIFSHPDRFTPDVLAAKQARYAEVQKLLGINTKVAQYSAAQARAKLREKIAEQKPDQFNMQMAALRENTGEK